MKLAVILPVYNAAQYLPECLNSVLNQNFGDFVVLAVNDCSTDESGDILEDFMRRDSRVRVHHLAHNSGEHGAANFAMNLAKTMRVKYVARMDSDDVCFPNRFAKQIDFLDHNPDITVCGSNIQTFDSVLRNRTELPESDGDIKVMFLMAAGNLANPTTMWRNDWFRQHEIEFGQYRVAGDYAMWTRCALKGAKFANLPDTLVAYRLHPNQLSKNLALLNETLGGGIWHDYARVVFPYLGDEELNFLGLFCYQKGQLNISRASFERFREIVNKINQEHTMSRLGENRDTLISYFQNLVSGVKNQ